ncbi:MAG: DUF4437 domain-containing protein [bacterium]|nr:DUF4437 domain-containing protein [bacterium]
MRRTRFATLSALLGAMGCATSPDHHQPTSSAATVEVVTVSDVVWEQLNPARGDQSPKAGTLWGDRKGVVPTGYLIRFEDGFCSPPHIHNVSYRGVVIHGLVHNDDPEAARMWLPAGSFWTQPKGEVHITAAKEPNNLAYIEIDEGPYLVLPTVRRFDSGERPVNVAPSNLVWLDAGALTDGTSPRRPQSGGAAISFLWGVVEPGRLRGAMLRLPAGFRGRLVSRAAQLRVIVIQGPVESRAGGALVRTLEPGSYLGADGPTEFGMAAPDEQCLLYVRANGPFTVERIP